MIHKFRFVFFCSPNSIRYPKRKNIESQALKWVKVAFFSGDGFHFDFIDDLEISISNYH
jgi:predicted AlkP superfamily pyrophosphatase or phosphodiesterase